MKITKGSIALIVLVVMLGGILAFGVMTQETPREFAEFDIAGPVFRALGFDITAIVSGRQYFFPLSDEHMNQDFIEHFEGMIYHIKQITSLTGPPNRLFLALDADEISIAPNDIRITHDDINTLGFFTHAWSGGRLPIWLTAGIEAVAIAEDTGRGFLAAQTARRLGDIYFTPAYNGTAEHNEAIDTAYRFARHLILAGEMNRLIDLYLSRDSYADELAERLFYEFSWVEFNSVRRFQIIRIEIRRSREIPQHTQSIFLHHAGGASASCSAHSASESR